MRITVKKKEKKQCKPAGLMALVLALILLAGMVPVRASAAESKENNILLEFGSPDYCRLKSAKLPGWTDADLLLYSWYWNGYEEECAKLYYSVSREGDRVSVPQEIQDDETWDMDPFIFTDNDATFNNNMLVAWTDANKKFDGTETKDEIAGSMRISVTALKSSTLVFANQILTVTKSSDNVSMYNPHVTKVGDKILITWVVCSDVKNDDGAYGIEGLYYDPDTNKFSSDDNKTDADGNVIPMVFAKSCNYISAHTAAELNGSVAVLYEEAVDGTHVSDVMYDQVKQRDQVSLYSPDEFKNNKVKLATNNGKNVDTVNQTNTYGSLVETDLSKLIFYCGGTIKEISTDSNSTSGWKTKEIADVSKTGDTRYSILSKDDTMQYITAREYTPFKTDKSEITLNGIKYTKSSDGKWLDEQNKEQDIRQEDIRLYYYNNTAGQAELLPKKLLGEDGVIFMAQPAIFINHSGLLDVTWVHANEDMRFKLYHTTYEQQSVQKADYTAVNEAVDKANALNKDDYVDFSAVKNAIDAVKYDKDYTKQETVEGYAKAIENAIKALKLRSADYTAVDAALAKVKALNGDLYKNFSDVTAAVNAVDRDKSFKEQADVDAMAKAIEDALAALELKPVDNQGTNNTTQGGSQSGANNANQGGAQSGTNNASPSVEQSGSSDTSQPDTSDVSLADTKSEVSNTGGEDKDTPSETSSGKSKTKEQSKTENKSPETGDSSHPELWIALFIISGGLFTWIMMEGKKKKL
jgi:hypothetical protein